MKKYIFLIFSFYTLNSYAQFITLDMFNVPSNIGVNENGYYYKDVTGYFNQFVGTWQYQNGTTTYTLQFKKHTFVESYPHVNKTYQQDELIGALKVVKNGTPIYNDLPTLNLSLAHVVKYNMYSIDRVENSSNCYICTYPNQRLYLKYKEPSNDNYAYSNLGFMMHTYTQSGVTKLRLEFRSDQINPNDFVKTTDFESVPNKTTLFFDFGTYDFVKVP